MESAEASGVIVTPTFFINGRRYDGPWDTNSLSEAMLGSLGHVVAAAALAIRLGIATKPAAYSWRQLAGAGALAGIGFTMSLFIASQAFEFETDSAAVKIAIFVGSIISAIIGTAILWNARSDSN